MSMEGVKYFKTSMVYAVGQISSQLLNLLLIAIYTNNLGTAEYGKLSTLLAITGFLSSFMILSIYSGFCRFYKEAPNKNKIFNTTLNFAYMLGLGVIAFLLFFGRFFNSVLKDYGNNNLILWIIVLTALFTEINSIYISKYSMEYRAFKIICLNFARLSIQLAASVYLVVIMKQGILGILSGQLIATMLVQLYLLVTEFKQFKFEISRNLIRKMLIFSCGLLPVNIAGWVLTLSDRYFINYFRGFAQTGIYNLGYQFGMLINPIFVVPFLATFTAYKFEIYKNSDAREKFKNLFRKYNLIGCFLMLSIAIFAKPAILLLSNSEFQDAYLIVPFILYSYFLYGKTGYYALGLQIKNKTYKIGAYMSVCALLNVFLNFIFVPLLGITGAALTTIICYYLLNIILIMVSRKEYCLDLDLKYTNTIEIITILLYLVYRLISGWHMVIGIEMFFGMLVLGIYMFLIFGLKMADRQIIMDVLHKINVKDHFAGR